jgi:hypothetical protein
MDTAMEDALLEPLLAGSAASVAVDADAHAAKLRLQESRCLYAVSMAPAEALLQLYCSMT